MKRKILSLCCTALAAFFLGGPAIASAVTPPEAVVCVYGGHGISIINVTNPSTITTVPIPGSAPTNVAITPTATQAWVCNETTNSVSVIDLSSNTIVASISSLPGVPTGIAIRPDGSEAWVTTSSGVTVINVASQVIDANITVSGDPQGIAITSDNKQAWVTQNSTNSVAIIDLASRTPQGGSIGLGAAFQPTHIAMMPNQAQAWVCSHGTTKVAAINIADKSVSTLDVGHSTGYIAITPDGTQAWVEHPYVTTMSVIDIANRGVSTISVGGGSSGVAITPDNTQAWECNSADDNIFILDRVSHAQLQTVFLGSGAAPAGIAITPDQAPTARFTAKVNGATVTFDGSSSTSPLGGIASYTWDFGDGTPSQTVTTPQISHSYSGDGTFTVTLTVTNSQGTSTAQTFTGQTVSNNGGLSARASQQVTVRFAPFKFKGKPKIHRHDKKLFIKTKWTASNSSNLASYKIAGNHKTRAIIPVTHKRKYTLRLHPQHFPRKHISKDYKRYLQHKYSIRAVNANGAVSTPTFLRLDH